LHNLNLEQPWPSPSGLLNSYCTAKCYVAINRIDSSFLTLSGQLLGL